MNFIPSNKLLEKIKSLLLDEPLDIYFEDSNTFTTSIIELANPRSSDYGRTVGSANMLIATSILNYEMLIEGAQQEDYSDNFTTVWSNIIESLKKENFLRDTPETARENIYLAVNNETPKMGLNK